MKAWLKKFFKGMYVACKILIVVGGVYIVLWLLIATALIASVWLRAMVPPTTNNIIIIICVFFVIVFGLFWSTWD